MSKFETVILFYIFQPRLKYKCIIISNDSDLIKWNVCVT